MSPRSGTLAIPCLTKKARSINAITRKIERNAEAL